MRKLVILIMLTFFLGGCSIIDQTAKAQETELKLLPQNAFNVAIQEVPFISEFDLSKVTLANFTESEGVLYFTVESVMYTRTKSIYSYRWSDKSLKSMWDFKDEDYYVSSIAVLDGKMYFCGHHNETQSVTIGSIYTLPYKTYEIVEISANGYQVIETQKTLLYIPTLSVLGDKITYLTSVLEESIFTNTVRTIDSSGKQNILWQEYNVKPVSFLRKNGISDGKYFYFIDYSSNSERIIRLTSSGKSEEYLFPMGTYSLKAKGDQVLFESQGDEGLSYLHVISKNFYKLDTLEASLIYRFDPILILSENRFLLTVTDPEDMSLGGLVIGVKKGNQNSYFYIPKLLSIYGLVNGIVLEDGMILIWGGVYKYKPDIGTDIFQNVYILNIKKP